MNKCLIKDILDLCMEPSNSQNQSLNNRESVC